ncbi:MAG: ribose-phosphate pyrophosphokinase [Thermomicrobia bacterium]|nr:ribose-phosphate pyrophosphokinase [Thermomicrobia bacterium]
MDGRLQVFSAGANRPLAGAIVNDLGIPLGRALVGAFRNGETRVRIEENVRGSDVFIVQPMCSPVNQHLMDLLIMIDAVRRSSAGRITAVIPYYAYAKQEKKTVGREPISAKLVANLLVTAGVDRVLTVDLHAPAIEGFFDIPVDHLRAAPILANYIKREGFQELVVVSPDAGGVARADDFRSRIGGGLAIFSKMRHAPDTAAMLDMVGEVSGKTAIIIDDMISTGGTLIEAAQQLRERGALAVFAAAVHGVFADGALAQIAESRIERLWVTDTLLIDNAIATGARIAVLSVAPLLAQAIQRIHKDLSVSSLFD